MKYIAYTMDGVLAESSSREEFIAELAKKGHPHTGDFAHCRTVNPILSGKPEFEGLCGPTKDGDTVRYESWDLYYFLST